MQVTTLPYMGKPSNQLDLVDQMNWEDNDKVELISIDDGMEEGFNNPMDNAIMYSILEYVDWFYDGEQSEFDK